MLRSMAALAVLLVIVPRGSWADPPANPTSLDGAWEISALIEDGEVVPGKSIREIVARDAKLTVSGQTITLIRPRSGETKTLLFINDPKTSPASIDFAGSDKIGSKGIYLVAGDTAMLCVSTPGVNDRPTDFSSKEGTHHILMTLKRIPAVTAIPAATSFVGVPETPVAPRPVLKDDAIRNILLGTWGDQDAEKIQYGTFNADGTFSMSMTWKKGFRKIFDEATRSSGSWSLRDGVIIVKITTSTDREIQGQVYSYRINTINDREMVLIDNQGRVRREWKTR